MHSTRRFKNGYDDIYNDSLLDVYVQNRTKIELRLSKGMRPKRMDQPLYVQHISRMRRGEVIIFDNATVAGASGILRLIRINKQFTVM